MIASRYHSSYRLGSSPFVLTEVINQICYDASRPAKSRHLRLETQESLALPFGRRELTTHVKGKIHGA